MPENWKTYKLDQLCLNITDGAHASPKEYVQGEKMIATVKDMTDYGFKLDQCKKISDQDFIKLASSGCIPDNGDVLFSKDGTIGKVLNYKSDFKIGVLSSIAIFKPKRNLIDNTFLALYLSDKKINQFIVDNFKSGSAIPRIILRDFKKFELRIPPLQEQKAIASILSALDDKIELNLQMNKTLEEMANISFRQWFIEEMGDDWETIRLKNLIEIKGGFSYKGEFIGSGSSLLLGMGCVSFSNRFLSSGARQYSGKCNLTHLVKPGDLVIATRQQSDNMPILGFPAIIPVSLHGKKVIVGTNLYRVINNSHFSNNLLFQLMRSSEYQNHILANSKGSTVRMITKDAIELFEFKIPPLSLLEKYDKEITGFGVQIEHNMMENQTLTNLRDTLLPKLISGAVRVKDIEPILAAAL